jgi:hypothetical protein
VGKVRSGILSATLPVSMNFSKWLYFQYVLRFGLQKRPFPTFYFQYVLRFGCLSLWPA